MKSNFYSTLKGKEEEVFLVMLNIVLPERKINIKKMEGLWCCLVDCRASYLTRFYCDCIFLKLQMRGVM